MLMRTDIIRTLIVTGLILCIPAAAMRISEGWNWSLFDFIFAFVLLFSVGMGYAVIARQGSTILYRAGSVLAVASMLLLVWVNAAVGIAGDDDPMNVMYPGVVMFGIVAAFLLRRVTHGMAKALFLTAGALALAGAFVILFRPHAAPGLLPILGIHAFFIMLFCTSALLFRVAPDPARAEMI
jgi:hypothetical protein